MVVLLFWGVRVPLKNENCKNNFFADFFFLTKTLFLNEI